MYNNNSYKKNYTIVRHNFKDISMIFDHNLFINGNIAADIVVYKRAHIKTQTTCIAYEMYAINGL